MSLALRTESHELVWTSFGFSYLQNNGSIETYKYNCYKILIMLLKRLFVLKILLHLKQVRQVKLLIINSTSVRSLKNPVNINESLYERY